MTAKEAIELAKAERNVVFKDCEGDQWPGYEIANLSPPACEPYEPFTAYDVIPRGKISKAAAEELKNSIESGTSIELYRSEWDELWHIIDDMTEGEEK